MNTTTKIKQLILKFQTINTSKWYKVDTLEGSYKGSFLGDIIKSVCSYFQIGEDRNLFMYPLVINSDKDTLRITKGKIKVLQISNHEEPHQRLIFHAKMNNKAVVTVVKDAGVLLLLIYTLGQLEYSN